MKGRTWKIVCKPYYTKTFIEPADGPTAWINLVVLVPKKQGGGRLCIDMRMANKAIKCERHVMPTFDEVIIDLNVATIFSKVDLKSGYHQLVLSEDSRNITTFSTDSFGISATAVLHLRLKCIGK